MSDQPHGQSGQVRVTPEGGPVDVGSPPSGEGAGQVRLTPEAGPLPADAGQGLTPPTLRDHMQGPIQGLDDRPASASGTRTGPATPPSVTGAAREEPARETGADGDGMAQQEQQAGPDPAGDDEELKKWPPYSGKPVSEAGWDDAKRYAAPVVSQAEKLAIKAIDLSGRGLTRLASFLENRRTARQASEEEGQSDPR